MTVRVRAKKFRDMIIHISKLRKEKKKKRKHAMNHPMPYSTVSQPVPQRAYVPMMMTAQIPPQNSGLSQSHQIITSLNNLSDRLTRYEHPPIPQAPQLMDSSENFLSRPYKSEPIKSEPMSATKDISPMGKNIIDFGKDEQEDRQDIGHNLPTTQPISTMSLHSTESRDIYDKFDINKDSYKKLNNQAKATKLISSIENYMDRMEVSPEDTKTFRELKKARNLNDLVHFAKKI